MVKTPLLNDDIANLVAKMSEIEEQTALALQEVLHGLTHSRLKHIRVLAKYARMRLEGHHVAPTDSLPEVLRPKGKRPS